MEAAAHQLLRFDERHALRTDNPVSADVGWLDFSHALTFGHAVRQVCAACPALWPAGLLQLALFVGRNTPYLCEGLESPAAQAAWNVDDAAAFDTDAQARIVDHGIGLPIFAAHRLKTWLAMRDTLALGATSRRGGAARRGATSALGAVQAAPRIAQQALHFVERE